MDPLQTVSDLCRERGWDHHALGAKAELDPQRVLAILEGRWTPSPTERDKIAGALGLTREQIAWGHRTLVQHLYGHGPQFGRTP